MQDDIGKLPMDQNAKKLARKKGLSSMTNTRTWDKSQVSLGSNASDKMRIRKCGVVLPAILASMPKSVKILKSLLEVGPRNVGDGQGKLKPGDRCVFHLEVAASDFELDEPGVNIEDYHGRPCTVDSVAIDDNPEDGSREFAYYNVTFDDGKSFEGFPGCSLDGPFAPGGAPMTGDTEDPNIPFVEPPTSGKPYSMGRRGEMYYRKPKSKSLSRNPRAK